jgi:hypothetical protein
MLWSRTLNVTKMNSCLLQLHADIIDNHDSLLKWKLNCYIMLANLVLRAGDAHRGVSLMQDIIIRHAPVRS